MLSEIWRKLRPFIWLLPGFLLWASFPPMGERQDVLFALAPLLWLSRRSAVRKAVRWWFLNGLFFWVATLSWMPAIVKNGGPWPLVVLGWAGLAAYCALYFAAFGFLSASYWCFARSRSFTSGAGYGWRLLGILVVEPVLWAGLELVRSRFLGGFAWNQLGVVVANAGFGAPAALGGVYVLGMIVILINGTFAGMAERMFPRLGLPSGVLPAKAWRSVETVLPLAIVWGAFAGAERLTRHWQDAAGDELRVAMVQRNFACVFQNGGSDDPQAAYAKLVANVAHLKPDLVVLSESALSEFGTIGGARAADFARSLGFATDGAAVLAGGTRQDGGRLYNSAALYGAEFVGARPTAIYDKVHLVPFGEFIPGDKWFPFLQKLAPVGSCTSGELRLMALPAAGGDRPFGTAICFEDTDSALVRHFAARGARFLVFITNDSWFSRSVEAEQHAWQAVARAIETGLTVVRVGNSGVTGVITPDGRPTWLTGEDGRVLVDRAGTLFDRVCLRGCGAEPTPYVRLGDVPLALAFALLLASMGAVRALRARRVRSCECGLRD